MEQTIKVMEFDKLDSTVKDEVIDRCIDDIIAFTDWDRLSHRTNLWKAYRECEEMRTPWFLGSYIWDKCKRFVLRTCREYLYTADGLYSVSKAR